MRPQTDKKTVGLFATCLVDLIRPEVGFAAAKLIEQSGFVLDVPVTQTCCGQPLYNSGDLPGTRKIARHLIDVFANYDYVVVPSGSCAAMIKIHIPELFAGESGDIHDRALELAERTYELTEFLSNMTSVEFHTEYPELCTYHDSCSGFRELGIRHSPRALLSQIKDLTLTECNESTACCGFGGTFCVKYPQISAKIAAQKVQNIEATGANTLLGGDLGCLLNIQGLLSRQGSQIRVLHVAEVLAGYGDRPAIGEPRS